MTSYSYDSAKKELVSYDTPHIASLKAQYVNTKGLGGGMFWEVRPLPSFVSLHSPTHP